MPRIADMLNVLLDVSMDVPNETIVPPPSEQFPQEHLACEPLPATAQNQNHAPIMTRIPTTGACWQCSDPVADAGKGPPGRIDTSPTGVSTFLTFCNNGTTRGTRNMVKTILAQPPPSVYPPQGKSPLANKKKEQAPEQLVKMNRNQGVGCGSNKEGGDGGGNGTVKRRGRGGGPGSSGRDGGGGLCFLPLVRVLLVVVVCGLRGVEGFDALPNGDGSTDSNSGTLRGVIFEWIFDNLDPLTYGPIEDWDISEVTNMENVFLNRYTFNADLSKWNTSAVTTMKSSKCNLSPSFLRVVFLKMTNSTILNLNVLFFWFCCFSCSV